MMKAVVHMIVGIMATQTTMMEWLLLYIAAILGIAVIGLVISAVVNAFLAVKLK